MKNKIILVLTFFVLSTVACKKQLNTIPEGSIPDLNTFSAVKIAVIGCYEGLKAIAITTVHQLRAKQMAGAHYPI
jgi:hypothetical protein